jgi:hypothetical protein
MASAPFEADGRAIGARNALADGYNVRLNEDGLRGLLRGSAGAKIDSIEVGTNNNQDS